eukprot:Nitzschia sp. Nitz4//scaffold88_size82704//21611//24445//NITZ4_005286-RA/size82704-processed-gene-0.47-mRNA-1//1//CDS//3329559476//3935//frame0
MANKPRLRECCWILSATLLLCLKQHFLVVSALQTPNVREHAEYRNRPPTVFSPTGRLHPVEAAIQAIQDQRMMAMAMKCKDGIIVLATLPQYSSTFWFHNHTDINQTQSLLLSTTSSTFTTNSSIQGNSTTDTMVPGDLPPDPFFACHSRKIVGICVGNPLHTQILRFKVQDLAEQVVDDDDDYGSISLGERGHAGVDKLQSSGKSHIPLLARAVADHLQLSTQSMDTSSGQGPLLECSALLVGEGQIWKVDPTGQFWNCQAAILGKHSQRIQSLFLDKLVQLAASLPNEQDDEMDSTPRQSTPGEFLEAHVSTNICMDLIVECVQDTLSDAAEVVRQQLDKNHFPPMPIPWVAMTIPKQSSGGLSNTKRPFLQQWDDYNLRNSLESSGMTIEDMNSDGNCLFRALSDQLYGDRGGMHAEIRSDICDFLEQNQEEFQVFLVLDDEDCEEDGDAKDFEGYVQGMRADGEWGGNLELVAAARLYQRDITVFTATLAAYTIEHGERKPDGPPLLVSFHDNDHYNSVRDGKPPKPPSSGLKQRIFKQASLPSQLEGDRSSTAESSDDKSAEEANASDTKDEPVTNNEEAATADAPRVKKGFCPCGSGLRYKKCCLAKKKHAARLEKLNPKPTTAACNVQEVEMKGNFSVLQI